MDKLIPILPTPSRQLLALLTSGSPQEKRPVKALINSLSRTLTPAKCLDFPHIQDMCRPSISNDPIAKAAENAAAEASVMLAIVEILSVSLPFWKVKEPMDGADIMDLADILMEKYRYESIEDVMLVMRKAKLGEFGTIYNRVDGHVVLEWFAAYLEEKAGAREIQQSKPRAPLPGEEVPAIEHLSDQQVGYLKNTYRTAGQDKPERNTYEGHTQNTKEKIAETFINDKNAKQYRYSDNRICTSLTELHLQSNPRKGDHAPEHNALIAVYENEIERRGDNYKPKQELLDNLERIDPQGKTIKNLQQRPITEVNAPADYKPGDSRKLSISYKEDENKTS